MKNIFRIFAVVVVLSALTSQSAYAGNDERRGTAGASELLINPWARNTGWGGVNVANVRGISSMFSNVAGLAFVESIEVAYSNTMLYGGKSGLSSGASINTFGLAVRIFEPLMKVHETAAFRQAGHTFLDLPADGFEHGFVRTELVGMEFGISSGKDYGIDIGQFAVVQRRELDDLRTHPPHQFDIVLIGETEHIILS